MPTDKNKSDKIEYPTPDELRSESDAALGERIVNVIDGEENINSESDYVPNDGRYINVKKQYLIKDEFGSVVPVSSYVGVSWDGHKIYKINQYGPCINPFRHKHFHDNVFRIVLVNKDGYITELGNILCLQCHKYNEWLKEINRLCPLWLYQQKVF